MLGQGGREGLLAGRGLGRCLLGWLTGWLPGAMATAAGFWHLCCRAAHQLAHSLPPLPPCLPPPLCSRNLSRETAWEAVMRIRCSTGLRISSFFGHFFIRSTDLLALPACDTDKVGAQGPRAGRERAVWAVWAVPVLAPVPAPPLRGCIHGSGAHRTHCLPDHVDWTHS